MSDPASQAKIGLPYRQKQSGWLDLKSLQRLGKERNGGLWIGPPLHRLLKNTSLALRPGSLYLPISLSSPGGRAFIRGGEGGAGTGSLRAGNMPPGSGRRNCFHGSTNASLFSLSLSLLCFFLACVFL
jgi:hypothetical protein